MSYAQNRYNELLGRVNPANGRKPIYRISQAGCFLVSMCNLLKEYGTEVDPLKLNRFFADKKIYADTGDGILDDLAYTSVSAYNPRVVVSSTGQGKPISNNSIVLMNYRSFNGSFSTHFSKVHDYKKGLILDSWDGQVKSWNVYGGPISWAAYKYLKPVHTKAVAVQPVPTSTNFNGKEITVLLGWGVSHVAKAAGFADWDKQSRWTEIAKLNGFKNWKDFNNKLSPGDRVRVKVAAKVAGPVEFVTVQRGWRLPHVAKAAGFKDYESKDRYAAIAKLNGSNDWSVFSNKLVTGQRVRVRTKDQPKPVVKDEPKPAPKAEKVEVKKISYKESYKDLPKKYIAIQDVIVKDLDGLKKDLPLSKNNKVNGAGVFTKGGVEYVLSVKHRTENAWYGIPKICLVEAEETSAYVGPLVNEDADIDEVLNDLDFIQEAKEALNNLTAREKFVAAVARVQGSFLRLFDKFKKDK